MKDNNRNTRRKLRVNVIDRDGLFCAYLEGSMRNIVRFVRDCYPGCKIEVVA